MIESHSIIIVCSCKIYLIQSVETITYDFDILRFISIPMQRMKDSDARRVLMLSDVICLCYAFMTLSVV